MQLHHPRATEDAPDWRAIVTGYDIADHRPDFRRDFNQALVRITGNRSLDDDIVERNVLQGFEGCAVQSIGSYVSVARPTHGHKGQAMCHGHASDALA